MFKFMSSGPAGIQYGGQEGVTRDCIDAVARLLQSRTPIAHVRILSYRNQHGFLLKVDDGELLGVKAGFASGYSGEGAKGLSYILTLLEAHEVPVDEVDVSIGVLQRLNASALTANDLKQIQEGRPIHPRRWPDYIFSMHNDIETNGKLWDKFAPVIPFAIVDQRIADLAKEFWSDPDQRLQTAYRRLEDIVRERAGSSECGAKLFTQVFNPAGGPLGWPTLDPSEQVGRMQLFNATYMAYRNPRAHRELDDDGKSVLAEFLLVNHLYRLEREAVGRSSTPARL